MPDPTVGSAAVPINPPLGASIPGYFEDRFVSGVKNDLFAHALVIEAEPALAILSLDIIAIPRETVLAIRQAAEEELGIAGERVFVHATHTHTGGPVWGAFGTATNQAYLDDLVCWCGEALAKAQATALPAALGFASTQVPGFSFNRRYWMKDGSVRTNPGIGNPEVVRPAGPVNNEMALLAFRPAAGPLTLVVNYALHLDTVGGTEVCADYPGYMKRTLQETLGPDTQVLFLNGACGDINHLDVLGGPPPTAVAHDLFMEVAREGDSAGRIGQALAQAVLSLLPDLEYADDWEVAEAHRMLTAGVRQGSPEQLERARALRAARGDAPLTDAGEIYDREALRLYESGETEAELEIQALRLGPVALVGIPNEVFAELGQEIQSRSPFAHTLVVELANGCEGYLPTPRAFAEGGYETMLARSSKLVPEAGAQVVEKAVEALGELAIANR
jgi:hypothetical protein